MDVILRCDFSTAGDAATQRPLTRDRIAGANVRLTETAVAATTGPSGRASLDTSGLDDGTYEIAVSPAAASTAAVPAGPQLTLDATVTPRAYLPFTVTIDLRNGDIDAAEVSPPVTHAHLGNREGAVTSGALPVDWKPSWVGVTKARNTGRLIDAVTLVVVHCTGGDRVWPAVNWFLDPGPHDAHYVISRSGHVLKMINETNRSSHAGNSRWNAVFAANAYSVGVELVNGGGPYTDEQYSSLVGLLDELYHVCPTLELAGYVGHCDVNTLGPANPVLHPNRRIHDPGPDFDWPRVEQAGFGLVPGPLPDEIDVWDGIFGEVDGLALRRGDRDPTGGTAVLGGAQVRTAKTPIAALQGDLEAIGYSLRLPATPLGTFGDGTRNAVDHFQRHFFAGSRLTLLAGQHGVVDGVTARWISAVANP